MTFSSYALSTIEAFAGTLGLSVAPAADGSYGFVFERSGILTLTAIEGTGRIVVSLCLDQGCLSVDAEERLLSLAGPDVTTKRFLAAGLTRDGGVLFAITLDEEEMNLPLLEECTQQLMTAGALFRQG